MRVEEETLIKETEEENDEVGVEEEEGFEVVDFGMIHSD